MIKAARVMPPTLGAPPELRTPPVARYHLSNGLRVLVVEQHVLPIVDVQLVMRTGAVIDGAKLAGRTSLAIDMLDEGTTARSAIDIAESVEDIGAALSASASWDECALGLHVHRDRLTQALELLADVVLRPTMPAADFERKKRERLTALLQEKEEPRILASQAFSDVVYGSGHPYGRPLHGTQASVEGMTRADVVAFHDQFVRPANSFIVVAGDVKGEDIVEVLEQTFGAWSGAVVEPMSVLTAPARLPTEIHIVDRRGSRQSELRIGCAAVARNTPDYFALLVMNTVLGGSFTSRLNLNLRQDKGYTYGAGSSFAFRLSPGPFAASTAVDTAVTDDAVRQVLLEIDALRTRLVPADELERAQSYLALGLPRSFETTGDLAGHVAELEIYGLGDDYFDGYVRRVRDVSAADVQQVALQYLDPAAMAVVVAGDRARIEAPLEALGIGPVYSRKGGD